MNPGDPAELLAWVAYKAFLTHGHDRDSVSVPHARAMQMHEDVLRQYPTSVITHFHLGDLYWIAARLEEAMAEYEEALRLAPRLGGTHTRVAYCLLGLGELERAKDRLTLACRARSVTPAHDVLLAEAHLLLGHNHEGWRRQYLLARHFPGRITTVMTHHVRAPWWDGQYLEGALLIGGCDGYGDVLQCVRYVPLAGRRVGSLTLLVSDALVPLFEGQFEGVPVRAYSAPPDPRFFAAWLPIMCLPHVLGIRSAQDIPPTPYIQARQVFRPLAGDFKVGIRWAGQPSNAHDLMRSTHLHQWAPVLSVRGATFYSFQFETAVVQLGEAVGAKIIDLAPELGDWNQTAAALVQMDLVIAVDSSLAHLAGALDRPVWIPLQAAVEWRWGLESPVTPWYPSARLYRQRACGDWSDVFAEVARDLTALVAARSSSTASHSVSRSA
ncbi:MAG: glycosyltransferase family 9 protein [Gemmatimonadales bacterium]